MRPDQNHRWLDLADRIGAGDRVDWDAERADSASPRDQALLRSLHTLSAINQLHTRDRRFEMPPLPSVDDAPAPDGWGGLRIDGRLGHGSYGTVYDAYDPKLDRPVALKLLHPGKLPSPEARRRILEEGRALARVRHPHLVQVYGLDQHDGQVGVAMEKIEGETLAARLQWEGPLGEDELRSVALTLGQAVAAVHQAGLLHRDIKAQNIMREKGGRLVLMDLGTATPRDASSAGMVTGTPLYLAPELLQGGPASPQSDVYSLGVLLFHLATGSFPIQATDLDDLKAAHFSGDRRRLADLRPELSAQLGSILDRATHADPSLRFASAGELVHALGGRSAGAPASPLPAPSRRRPWLLAAAVLAVLLAVGSIGRWSSGRWGWGDGGLEVESSLFAWSSQARRELFGGAEVHVGDELSLEITLNTTAHVYVLTEDDRGTAWVMFPRPEFALQNPLPAGDHLLPEANAFWGVDTEGGREHILVLASRDPLPALESQLAALTANQGKLDEGSLMRVRGIGRVVRRNSATREGTSLLAQAESALARGQTADGVWMRTFVLHHPD